METEEREWGSFTVLYDGPLRKVKFLTLKPGKCISYQRHAHRAEFWCLLEGEGEVIIDTNSYLLKQGTCEEVFIEETRWHQLRNAGDQDLIILEIQYGTYFGEDDIERLTREWYFDQTQPP